MAEQTCARKGCHKSLPVAARRNGDPYCSRVCCEVALGVMTRAKKKEHNERSKHGTRGAGASYWNRTFSRKQKAREKEQ